MTKAMTYAGVGVDYDAMDPFKRAAQLAGRATAENLPDHGVSELEASRGESAYLIETGYGNNAGYLAHVEEGLGTKNLVADAMYQLTGRSYYDHIAQDTVAMIVNDMVTVGAQPLSVAMHLAVGDSRWFDDERRSGDLVRGWKHACDLAACAWGCGETPTLKDVVMPDTVVLSGSAMGKIDFKNDRLCTSHIQDGDAIIMIESSGIHANGLTLARAIAAVLPKGYLTTLPDGRSYGETLLDPTPIYVPAVTTCQARGIPIRYAVNITGHGWRKLMRAPQSFAYIIDTLPTARPIFDFIQTHGPVSDQEAYGNLNMGAGFALFVDPHHVSEALAALEECWGNDQLPRAFRAGTVRTSSDKKVVIVPKNLEYAGSTLGVR